MAEALTAHRHENENLVEPYRDVMGQVRTIEVFDDHLEAAADPRSDGAALGL